MSEHPNVTTVNRMNQAIGEQDKATLGEVFVADFDFHLRGPFPKAGDHVGVDGFLDVIGSIFEATNGDVELEQIFCIGTDGWAVEWERSVLGRNGSSLESQNAFVYRFDGSRIAEMWMLTGARAEKASFFT
jgi:ketosteroid isomerase-like protein